MSQTSTKLNYVLATPRTKDPRFKALVNQAFEAWHTQWQETLKQKTGENILTSDHFLRQAEVSALFVGQECAGVFLFDWFDLSNQIDTTHSYFHSYPPAVLSALRAEGVTLAFAASYLAVVPKFRKLNSGLKVSSLIVGLSAMRFSQTSFNHLITYSRNLRHTNQLIYAYGAKPIAENLEAWGEPSDFIYMKREDALASDCPLKMEIAKVWKNRIQEKNPNPLFKKEKTK